MELLHDAMHNSVAADHSLPLAITFFHLPLLQTDLLVSGQFQEQQADQLVKNLIPKVATAHQDAATRYILMGAMVHMLKATGADTNTLPLQDQPKKKVSIANAHLLLYSCLPAYASVVAEPLYPSDWQSICVDCHEMPTWDQAVTSEQTSIYLQTCTCS